jgi:hypothetical protein
MNNEMCDNDSNSRIKKLRNEHQKPSSPRDNAPALLVVLINTQVQDVLALLDVEAAVDLVLDGQTVAVPAEAASDVIAVHRLVAGDNVLYGAGEDVAVVREPRGEGRPVIEDVLRLVLGALQLGLEGLYLRPQLEDLLLVFGEGEVLPFAHFVHGGSRVGEREREGERLREGVRVWRFYASDCGRGFVYIYGWERGSGRGDRAMV